MYKKIGKNYYTTQWVDNGWGGVEIHSYRELTGRKVGQREKGGQDHERYPKGAFPTRKFAPTGTTTFKDPDGVQT